jgi:hypothetical protein
MSSFNLIRTYRCNAATGYVYTINGQRAASLARSLDALKSSLGVAVEAGWSINAMRTLDISASRTAGVQLHLEQSTATRAWCREHLWSGAGLETIWTPTEEEELSRARNGRKSYDLGIGLYDFCSTWRSGSDVRRFVVVSADAAPALFETIEEARVAAVEAGALVLPAADELWGAVRALCAAGDWRKAMAEVVCLVRDAELREALATYCAAAQAEREAKAAAVVALPALTGSEKQIKWATDLRRARVELLANAEATLSALEASWPELHAGIGDIVALTATLRRDLESKAQARHWIDQREAYQLRQLAENLPHMRVCLRRGADDLTALEMRIIAENEHSLTECA